MVNAWPESLLPPAPLVSRYEQQTRGGIARTEMESGMSRQRRRFTAVPTKLTCSWAMTGDELEIFRAFIEYKAAYGAAWFTIRLPIDTGSRTVYARFTGEGPRYELSQPGTIGEWWVHADLEFKDPPPLNEEAYDVLLTTGLAQLLAIDAALDTDETSLLPFFTTYEVDFGA